MKKAFLLSCYLIVSIVLNSLLAQKITVQAHIDSASILIGSQTHLKFAVTQKPGKTVVFPNFKDTIVAGLELVAPYTLDTTKTPDGLLQVTQNCVVTSFADSLLYIRPFPFIAANGDTVWSKSLSIKVVQPYKIDTTKQTITDIKNVFKPKFDWLNFLKWMLLAFLIVALLIVTYFIIRRYVQKKPVFNVFSNEAVLTPYELALNKLDKIKQEKAWQHNRAKEYHTELTDVVRQYIEETFGISSMEMTSDEILEHLESLKYDKKSAYDGLKQILKLADLVKFAKWNPGPEEHELSLLNSYLFVNQTKTEEVKPIEAIQDEIKKDESSEK